MASTKEMRAFLSVPLDLGFGKALHIPLRKVMGWQHVREASSLMTWKMVWAGRKTVRAKEAPSRWAFCDSTLAKHELLGEGWVSRQVAVGRSRMEQHMVRAW